MIHGSASSYARPWWPTAARSLLSTPGRGQANAVPRERIVIGRDFGQPEPVMAPKGAGRNPRHVFDRHLAAKVTIYAQGLEPAQRTSSTCAARTTSPTRCWSDSEGPGRAEERGLSLRRTAACRGARREGLELPNFVVYGSRSPCRVRSRAGLGRAPRRRGNARRGRRVTITNLTQVSSAGDDTLRWKQLAEHEPWRLFPVQPPRSRTRRAPTLAARDTRASSRRWARTLTRLRRESTRLASLYSQHAFSAESISQRCSSRVQGSGAVRRRPDRDGLDGGHPPHGLEQHGHDAVHGERDVPRPTGRGAHLHDGGHDRHRPGPSFTLSLDGGRTSKTIRLKTATSYAIPYVGATIAFTSGCTMAEETRSRSARLSLSWTTRA